MNEGSEGTPPNTNDVIIQRDRFIFDLIEKRAESEKERSNILDSKASNIIGYVGLIIGLLVTVISFIFGDLAKNEVIIKYYSSYRILLLFGIIFLLGSIIASIHAYFVREYQIVPSTKTLIENYAKEDRDITTTLRRVSQEMSDVLYDNKQIIDEKAKSIKISLTLFAIGIGLIVLFVIGLLMI
ncbi:MAG: hypothetical protein ACP5NU_01210 [Methanomicrobiales archaeon]